MVETQEIQDVKQRLEAYLKSRYPKRHELKVTELEQLSGGLSYETYLFTTSWKGARDPRSESLVLRMEPEEGPTPPYDIKPQYYIMKKAHGTNVLVPKARWLETNSKVLGKPFMVMEKIEGGRFDVDYGEHPEHRVQLKKDFLEQAVNIHKLDWKALGLSVLGVPENNRQYAEKEITRWEWVFENNKYRPEPILLELIAWMRKNIPPAERTTICHGDYNPRNFLTRDGRIVVTLDWEIVGIGDPVSDIGWHYVQVQIGRDGWLGTLNWEWDEKDYLRSYEKMAGVKINEKSLFFWMIFSYVKFVGILLASRMAGMKFSQRLADNPELKNKVDLSQKWFDNTISLLLGVPARMLGIENQPAKGGGK